MIVEMRTYTLAMGATSRYFKLYGEKGLAVQKRILGHFMGYYAVRSRRAEQGDPHVGLREHGGPRQAPRRALADKEWLAYVSEVGGLVLHQENQILTPAPFFKLPQPA